MFNINSVLLKGSCWRRSPTTCLILCTGYQPLCHRHRTRILTVTCLQTATSFTDRRYLPPDKSRVVIDVYDAELRTEFVYGMYRMWQGKKNPDMLHLTYHKPSKCIPILQFWFFSNNISIYCSNQGLNYAWDWGTFFYFWEILGTCIVLEVKHFLITCQSDNQHSSTS